MEPPANLPATLGPGSILDGRYRVQALLGRGGMGSVWRCFDEGARQCEVAVKLVLPELEDSPRWERYRKRIEHEARAAKQVRHPNVVKVLDVSTSDDGHAYIVMEYLRGHDLREELDQFGPPALPRTFALIAQACSALVRVHELGIVHRDLKPENLMIEECSGQLKLLDFGIAKLPTRLETTRLTVDGMPLGTPNYMAPEQTRGGAATSATDVWALGAILYELLTGVHAFPGEDRYDVVASIRSGDIPRLEIGPPSVRAVVSTLLQGCLAQEPAARYTALQLKTAVEGIQHELSAMRESFGGLATECEGPTPEAATVVPTAAHRPRRRLVSLGAVALGVSLMIGWSIYLRGVRAPSEVTEKAPSPLQEVPATGTAPDVPGLASAHDLPRRTDPVAPAPHPVPKAEAADRDQPGAQCQSAVPSVLGDGEGKAPEKRRAEVRKGSPRPEATSGDRRISTAGAPLPEQRAEVVAAARPSSGRPPRAPAQLRMPMPEALRALRSPPENRRVAPGEVRP